MYPKGHVFFIPWDGGYNPANPKPHNRHIRSWIHFLKFTKHRTPLFLYTVRVNFSRYEDRLLKKWKNDNLMETMIPVQYLGRRTVLKVQSV